MSKRARPTPSPAAAAPPAEIPRVTREHAIAAGVVFVVSLCTYLGTLAPGLTGEDSGELISAAWTLGVPHEPGYPLWCMVTRVFMMLPIGDPAWRANFGSAFTCALACALCVPLFGRLGVRATVAGAAALLMATSSTLWAQSVIANVHLLTFLSLVGLLYSLLAWRQDGERWMFLAAYLTGVSLTTHQTIVLLSPVIFIYVAWVGGRRLLDPTRLLQIVGCIALGLTFYIYLPVRASALSHVSGPVMNWGQPDTWARFWGVVTRSQYPSLIHSDRSWDSTIGQMKTLANYYWTQWPGVITIFVTVCAALGLGALWKRDRPLAAWFVLWLLTMSVGFTVLLNFHLDQEGIHVAEKFFIPAWFIVVLLCAVGMEAIARRWGAVAWVVCWAVALAAVAGNWQFSTMRGNDVALRYGRDLLAALPPNAILFVSADYEAFPVYYLQIVEHQRTDVATLDDEREIGRALALSGLSPAASAPVPNDLVRLVQNGSRPVYSTRVLVPELPTAPVGLLYRTFADGSAASQAQRLDAAAWNACAPPSADGPWAHDWSTASILAAYEIARARSALTYGGSVDTALADLARAAARLPGDPIHQYNIGALLALHHQEESALVYLDRALVLRPHYALAQHLKVITLIALGRWDEAQAAYAQATSDGVSFGDDGPRIEEQLSKERAARPQLASLREQADAHPRDAVLGMQLAADEAFFNHLAEAEKDVRGVLDSAPHMADAWRALGEIRLRRGDRDGAVAAWREALNEQPTGPQADAVRTSLRTAGVTP